MALLPEPGPLRRLAFVTFVDSVGTGMFLTVSVLYFTGVAGFSVTGVAVGLSVAGLAALVAAIPLGALGDRYGYRRVWVVLTLVHAGAMASFPLVRSYPWFLVAVTVIALAEVGVSPVRGAYLSLLAGPAERVRARAHNQAVANAGLAIGAAGGAIALRFASPAGYAGVVFTNAVSELIAALALLSLPELLAPRRAVTRIGAVLRDRRYVVVSVLNGLLLTYAALPVVAFPIWLTRHTAAPAWTLGMLMVLNTILVVLGQVWAAAGAETVPGAARVVRWAGVALLVSCLLVAVTEPLPAPAAVAVLIAATVALTAGELWHAAGSWGLSFGLAPEDRQGEYLGAFAMGSRVYDAVGPMLVAALTLGLGAVGWVAFGVLLLALSLALARVAAPRHVTFLLASEGSCGHQVGMTYAPVVAGVVRQAHQARAAAGRGGSTPPALQTRRQGRRRRPAPGGGRAGSRPTSATG